MKTIDLGYFFNPVRIVAVMGERMMRIGDANLGINSHAALATEHHCRNPGKVCPKRHHLELIHQLRIIGQRDWYARWLLNCRRHLAIVLLGGLYPPFDLSYCRQIFVELFAVRSAKLPRELLRVVAHRIQDAASIESPPLAGFWIETVIRRTE